MPTMQCPQCADSLSFKQEHIGKRARCNRCNLVFTLEEVYEMTEIIDEPLSLNSKECVGKLDFIRLSCPSCSAKLKVTADMDRFACLHCGTEVLVKRGEGTISLFPVVEAIRGVQRGVDMIAAELTIARLRDDLRELNTQFNSESEIIDRTLTVKVALAQVRCDSLANLDIQGYREMRVIMYRKSFLFKKLLYWVLWVLQKDWENTAVFTKYNINKIHESLAYCCELRYAILAKQVELEKYKKLVEQ